MSERGHPGGDERDRSEGGAGRGAGEAAAALAERLRGELRETLAGAPLEVTAEGSEREIAVVRVPAHTLPDLLCPNVRGRVLASVREAGFRYGALDLSGEPEG